MRNLTGRASVKAGAVVRRWYVALFVLALMSIPVLHASRPSGIYWSKVDVVFYPPSTASGGNPLRSDALGIVHYAALIERLVDGHQNRPLLETTGAALYGTGLRHGYAIYLPNAGGQWQTQFNRAAISVEVVGESAAEVRSVQTGLVEKLKAAADERQASMGVIRRSFITTSLSPESPEIQFHPARADYAAAALSLLALGLAIAAAVVVDDILALRVARRTQGSKVAALV